MALGIVACVGLASATLMGVRVFGQVGLGRVGAGPVIASMLVGVTVPAVGIGIGAWTLRTKRAWPYASVLSIVVGVVAIALVLLMFALGSIASQPR